MKEQEFENLIKKSLSINIKPSKESLTEILSSIEIENSVTKSYNVRYSRWTTVLNIINKKYAEIVNIWKYKRILLIVPSFMFLFFIGVFSLSPSEARYSDSIIKLSEQDTSNSKEERFINEEDQLTDTLFDSSPIDDLTTIQNEI